MNKKLLGLVIAGVLAVISVPALNASAATSVQSTLRERKNKIGYATVKPGCDAYSNTNPSSKVGYLAAGDEVRVYVDSKTGASSAWACVRAKLYGDEDRDYEYYYVLKSDLDPDFDWNDVY